MKQQYTLYNAQDHAVWKCLFDRQIENLPGKVCSEYLECIEQLKNALNSDSIPDFNELDKVLGNITGWNIEVVPGLIPVDDFFRLLSQKRFCSSTWLRSMEQLDYLEEPDMFHDIFGHIPLLANNHYSKFIEKFGQIGLKYSHRPETVIQLQRLYWFTIEFGLIRKSGQLEIYGAGIISSFSETNGISSNKLDILPFDIQEVIHMEFYTDRIQDKYYVIESFEQLYKALEAFEKQLHIEAESLI